MNAILKLAGPPVVVFAIAACNAGGGSSSVPVTSQSSTGTPSEKYAMLWGPNVVAACPDPRPGEAQCLALIRSGPQIAADGGSGPAGGFTPVQLQAAYKLPSSTNGSGQLVAIVDAYDNPNVSSDLAFYRAYFGLPTANFTKYNQEGEVGDYPTGNTEWGIEEDLDVQMVSASCPNCSIALIEANSGSGSDLQAAEAEAVTLGAHIVSNSYVCRSDGCLQESGYDIRGVTYLAASGDWGYDVIGTPATFRSVVAVGGTSLYADSDVTRGFHETAWLGTGSGCSQQRQKKPAWQHDPGCKHRTTTDVAAVADPATGPATYDTYGFSGWFVVGGTSAAAPFLAGVFGLAGNATKQNGGETFWLKSHEGTNDLFHITQGYNGSCSPTYLCTDGTHEFKHYGGPTGWGTPNGIGAF